MTSDALVSAEPQIHRTKTRNDDRKMESRDNDCKCVARNDRSYSMAGCVSARRMGPNAFGSNMPFVTLTLLINNC